MFLKIYILNVLIFMFERIYLCKFESSVGFLNICWLSCVYLDCIKRSSLFILGMSFMHPLLKLWSPVGDTVVETITFARESKSIDK